MKKKAILFLLALLPMVASAYDAQIDGIYYYLYATTKTAEVTWFAVDNSKAYSGTVTIPEVVEYEGKAYTVTTIGSRAFYGCTGLTAVNIPGSVTTIGEYAFHGCSGLSSVTIPNSVSTIGKYAFMKCTGITAMTFPESVTDISGCSFQDCTSLASVTYLGNITSIGANAFKGCASLGSVSIPESVTTVGGEAFDGTAWYEAQADGLLYLDNWLVGYKGSEPTGDLTVLEGTKGVATFAFSGCKKITSVVIPASVRAIGPGTFRGCSGLASVTVGDGVTEIGKEAFSMCTALTSVVMPASVTYIGLRAFYRCYGLTSVELSDGLTTIDDNAFQACRLTSVHIPDGVTTIGTFAFFQCSSLNSVNIPASVTFVGNSAFGDTGWAKSQADGPLYLDGWLVGYQGGKPAGELAIEKGTKAVCPSAFLDCSGLTSLVIPGSVTTIGTAAFKGCTGLTSAIIGNKVDSIAKDTFYGCSGLTSLTIGNSVTTIGENAFYGCSNLTSVTIPNSVTSIGVRAFSVCQKLDSIILGKGVASISPYAFGGIKNLKEVYCYAEQVPSTDVNVFYNTFRAFATLHVPAGAIEAYQETEPWSRFRTIVALEGTTDGVPDFPVCAMPTIDYGNGRLSFESETEGVSFVSDITSTDICKHYDAEVDLSVAYTVKVYATKEGYEDSEVVTATLCWIDVEPKTDAVHDVATVPAYAVLIQASDGKITVRGVDDGTSVTVYDLTGRQVGHSVVSNGTATTSTTLRSGDTAIVRVGLKSVKVVL